MRKMKTTYSPWFGCSIVKGFTIRKVLIRKDHSEPYQICRPFHFTWNEEDLLYYRDDVDDYAEVDVPDNGEIHGSLKSGYYSRLLVIIDREEGIINGI